MSLTRSNPLDRRTRGLQAMTSDELGRLEERIVGGYFNARRDAAILVVSQVQDLLKRLKTSRSSKREGRKVLCGLVPLLLEVRTVLSDPELPRPRIKVREMLVAPARARLLYAKDDKRWEHKLVEVRLELERVLEKVIGILSSPRGMTSADASAVDCIRTARNMPPLEPDLGAEEAE